MIFHGKPEVCQVENITYPRILLSVVFKTPSLLLPAWSSQEGSAEQDLWGPLLLGCVSCKMRARSWTSPHPWVLPSPSVHWDILSPRSVIASWQVKAKEKALCGQKVYLGSLLGSRRVNRCWAVFVIGILKMHRLTFGKYYQWVHTPYNHHCIGNHCPVWSCCSLYLRTVLTIASYVAWARTFYPQESRPGELSSGLHFAFEGSTIIAPPIWVDI